MRKSKFSETQIVGILKDAEAGVAVNDLLRTHGISRATFFTWRPGTRERGHQGCPGPKIIGPSAKRQGAALLVGDHRLPVRRACRVMRLSRAAYYRPPVPARRRDAAVIAALTDVVARYPRWGFWKCFDRLRMEGRPWNHKHVHRVYCALRLNLPRRTTRRVPRRVRQPLAAPPVLNRTWALDFMSETLYDGRRVRLLTVIDEGNREGLEIAMGLSVPSQRVVRVLNELVAVHGCPAALRTDNGPEFIAQPFIDWCADHRVAIHYIQPGKPDQNAYIERFNRSYRTEVLNAHLFESIAELQALTMTWLRIYNGGAAARQPRPTWCGSSPRATTPLPAE